MALFVGFSTIVSNYAIGGVLIAFFVSSSLLTRLSASMKRRIDAEFKEGGQRDWKQVACNGFVPSVAALAYGFHTSFVQGPFLGGCDLRADCALHLRPLACIRSARTFIQRTFPCCAGVGPNGSGYQMADGDCYTCRAAVGATMLATALQGAAMGYYACCCGDTWASEVGVLSPSSPRMITSGRRVRRGTNGAVSVVGLVFSALGGMLLGLVGALFAVVGTPGGQVRPLIVRV